MEYEIVMWHKNTEVYNAFFTRFNPNFTEFNKFITLTIELFNTSKNTGRYFPDVSHTKLQAPNIMVWLVGDYK